MIICWCVFVIFSLMSSIFVEADSVCSVQPTAAVVVVGESVSLNCTSTRDVSIYNWQIGTNVENKIVVYLPQVFGRNGTVIRNKSVADGYSVTNETENKVPLYIKRITHSQAGLYVCQCDDKKRSEATSVVVVLASEPEFSNISSVNNGKEVSFFCNILFSGSADVSSNLWIENTSRSIVNSTVCSPNNTVIFCNLTYTIIADASIDQSYTCTVHLITSNSVIYSRSLNASVDWQRASSAKIVVSKKGKCYAKICAITCETNGSQGVTVFKWWRIVNNRSEPIEDSSQHLIMNEVGQFKYKCKAYSIIRGVKTSATSEQFTIDVTENEDSSSQILIVIGISVAIGVVAIIIAVVAIKFGASCSREQRSQTFRALSTGDSSAVQQRQPANRYDKTKLNNPVQQRFASTSTTDPVYATAAPQNDNKSVGTEVVVFDNDLYEGARCASPNLDIPLAGCIPEEGIYNEIRILE